MNSLPIGVYDSGLGGLTAVKELRRRLPGEGIIYFGDTGRVPYGNRSRETICKYTIQAMRFLTQKRVKMIIAACGTVSSVAEDIGNSISVPFTGVVRPAAKAAADATRSGRIGVIGTAATISSGSYRARIAELAPKARVFEQACGLLVPLVENGFVSTDDEVTRLVTERYLKPIIAKKVDTLILGCTHYPILKPIIGDVMGDGVTLIDAGEQAAILAGDILRQKAMLNESTQPGKSAFYVSDRTEGFSQIAGMFLGEDISAVTERVDLDAI
ncbi:MAG: glutamate racemase [Oscillospiraceae bacterium]|nr:glutamate racemase [Oscillospiraceae bacterium]